MNWLYYLLEANLYLISFYGFYRLFLHKETFYALNRYFLIFSSLTAFIMPFLQLGFLSKDIITINSIEYQTVAVQEPLFNIEHVLLFVYVLIASIFISKLIWGFRHIINLLRKPNKIVENGITIIELINTKTAFSFFNMLFIDPELPQKNTIIKHEMVHIKQRHSYDVLFFELLKSLSWFNPIAYLLKKDIKLLHEFLADEETTHKGIEKYEYAIFLIQNSYGNHNIELTNQIFNSSILKRRINMLNQKKSAKWARLRLLMVLPIVGGMLCTSTMAFTKDYGIVDLYPKKVSGLTFQQQDTLKKQKAKEVIIIEEPATQQTKKLKGIKPPPPPPIEAAPKAKSAKKNMAPPPPPVKPKSVKGEVLEIKLTPPPPPPTEPPSKAEGNKPKLTEVTIVSLPSPINSKSSKVKPLEVKILPPPSVESAPAKKKYDKDDVINRDPTPLDKLSVQIKETISKEIKDARLKAGNNNR